MKIEVSTREYERAHGKKPRGTGSWAFALNGKRELEDLVWCHCQKYSDALRTVKQGAPVGTRLIEVQP